MYVHVKTQAGTTSGGKQDSETLRKLDRQTD